jgi:hypothetical protein
MNTSPISYKRHRFPPQIIAHAVWLYFRFPLSLRLVEELLLERGIAVSYETIRRWGKKFGPDYARRLRRKKPSGDDVWHLDEVVITIAGRKRWLCASLMFLDQSRFAVTGGGMCPVWWIGLSWSGSPSVGFSTAAPWPNRTGGIVFLSEPSSEACRALAPAPHQRLKGPSDCRCRSRYLSRGRFS